MVHGSILALLVPAFHRIIHVRKESEHIPLRLVFVLIALCAQQLEFFLAVNLSFFSVALYFLLQQRDSVFVTGLDCSQIQITDFDGISPTVIHGGAPLIIDLDTGGYRWRTGLSRQVIGNGHDVSATGSTSSVSMSVDEERLVVRVHADQHRQ